MLIRPISNMLVGYVRQFSGRGNGVRAGFLATVAVAGKICVILVLVRKIILIPPHLCKITR